MPQHAVIINFNYYLPDLDPLFALEEKLEAAIEEAGTGEFDGNEVAVDGGDARLYMYGPDADKLFASVEPVLKTSALMKGANATLRYGPAADDVREVVRTIGA